MRWISRIAAAAACAILQACATAPVAAPGPSHIAVAEEPRAPVTILVSIDGFRPDYLERGVTPVLNGLAKDGVSAAMRPSFPSKTFPNHWAMVTGLRPDRSGIVANTMEDPAGKLPPFTMATDDPAWWNDAEPIWVAAEKAGIRTATMFWPGANVAWGGRKTDSHLTPIEGGTRPSDWQQFNQQVSGEQRVNTVLDWLRRPAAIRPRLVTLYFDTVDGNGHSYGPDAPETTRSVADVDRLIGMLTAELAALHQPPNLVIVADHGMAATSSARTLALDTIADPADYRVIETGPYASLAAVPGHEAALERRLLAPHPHLQCWRRRRSQRAFIMAPIRACRPICASPISAGRWTRPSRPKRVAAATMAMTRRRRRWRRCSSPAGRPSRGGGSCPVSTMSTSIRCCAT